MSDKARAELAPTGILRAGINLSNFLLVTGRSPNGDPEGARSLGVPVKLVPFESPGQLGDAVGGNVWDIGLIGAEPQRAEKISFTAAYVEIEAAYLVPPGSPITSVAEVDRKGVRIAYGVRSAYGLWLENNIKNATLMPTAGPDAFNRFRDEKLEVFAGLRPGLLKDVEKMLGATILPGKFSAVQQAVGTAKPNKAGATYLAEFVENAKQSGLVAGLIQKHKVKGLSVAPRANG
jgi:polar amino acid transport system substrate-binding protein